MVHAKGLIQEEDRKYRAEDWHEVDKWPSFIGPDPSHRSVPEDEGKNGCKYSDIENGDYSRTIQDYNLATVDFHKVKR